ncbi:hypothetical protein TYRP_010233 [Tyrophagus putrescentiae]|nr:hypothetical protein TYRP_010233 [Tyrophagus putrescentiae]
MPHWSDYSLRGWLSFLAFMHIGMAMRSFFDSTFIYQRVFSINSTAIQEPILVRLFGIFSLTQAFILIHSAVHLYVLPIQITAMFMMVVFVVTTSTEAFVFQTLDFQGGTFLPFVMSIISFVWLVMFHFVWKPWLGHAVDEDASFKTILSEGKKIRAGYRAGGGGGGGLSGGDFRSSVGNTEQYYRMQSEFLRRNLKSHVE